MNPSILVVPPGLPLHLFLRSFTSTWSGRPDVFRLSPVKSQHHRLHDLTLCYHSHNHSFRSLINCGFNKTDILFAPATEAQNTQTLQNSARCPCWLFQTRLLRAKLAPWGHVPAWEAKHTHEIKCQKQWNHLNGYPQPLQNGRNCVVIPQVHLVGLRPTKSLKDRWSRKHCWQIHCYHKNDSSQSFSLVYPL